MPPLWKIKRELRRLGRQALQGPRRLVWYLGATPYYDLALSRRRKTWPGAQPAGDKMAVYVIYPQGGLPQSSLMTLSHLAQNGYATTVVSNLPLPEEERAQILAVAYRYIERPNFGYDFGAYRDGVLSLLPGVTGMQRLVLLNDSVWYPAHDRSNWLADAEALGVDVAGAVSNYGTPRASHENYTRMDWAYRTDHANFHYCSFAISLGPNVLRAPGFARFWRRFRLDNDKTRVVRRGEIGFTQWAIRNGFSHGCTCNPGDLPQVLADLDTARLRQVVERAIFPEYPEGHLARAPVLASFADTRQWRADAIQYILFAATAQGTGYALPELTMHEMNFPFLKKSPLRLSKPGSDISLEIIEQMTGAMAAHIAQEAHALRNTRTAKYDAREKGKAP